MGSISGGEMMDIALTPTPRPVLRQAQQPGEGDEPTLEELKLIRMNYLQQGASVFTDLAMVARRLGLSCLAPIYHYSNYFCLGNIPCVLYENAGVSAVWREVKQISGFYCESLLITIGKPVLSVDQISQPLDVQAFPDQAIYRENIICWLKRINIRMGEHSAIGPVEIELDDAKFIPGKWVSKFLEQLDYARELTGSMHEMIIEKQRTELFYDLMIGRNI